MTAFIIVYSFHFVVKYSKTLDKYCSDGTLMKSTNVNDAKKECSNQYIQNKLCHMFYEVGRDRTIFYACEITSSIKDSSSGSTLYQPGNKTYTQLQQLKTFSSILRVVLV